MSLLLPCLWPVPVGKRKQLGSCLPVQGRGKLVNGRRYFQPLIEDGTLLLQLNVAEPFDKGDLLWAGCASQCWSSETFTKRIRHPFDLLFPHNGECLPSSLSLFPFSVLLWLEERPMFSLLILPDWGAFGSRSPLEERWSHSVLVSPVLYSFHFPLPLLCLLDNCRHLQASLVPLATPLR